MVDQTNDLEQISTVVEGSSSRDGSRNRVALVPNRRGAEA